MKTQGACCFLVDSLSTSLQLFAHTHEVATITHLATGHQLLFNITQLGRQRFAVRPAQKSRERKHENMSSSFSGGFKMAKMEKHGAQAGDPCAELLPTTHSRRLKQKHMTHMHGLRLLF